MARKKRLLDQFRQNWEKVEHFPHSGDRFFHQAHCALHEYMQANLPFEARLITREADHGEEFSYWVESPRQPFVLANGVRLHNTTIEVKLDVSTSVDGIMAQLENFAEVFRRVGEESTRNQVRFEYTEQESE